MKKLEPLLKDEVETFPFLEEKPKKEKGKFNLPLIITIILSVIILPFAGKTMYAFYVGFRYYDLRFENENVEEEKEQPIDSSSAVLNQTYQKHNLISGANVLSLIYKNEQVDIKNLSNLEKIAMVFDYLKINCSNPNASKTKDALKLAAMDLFGDDSIINNLNTDTEILGYKVTMGADANSYNISLSLCSETKEFVDRTMLNATAKDNEMYIYEKFGYFIANGENTYNVYGDGAKSNLITTFTDSNKNKEFTNKEILKTYKLTYQKGNSNNYYLVSITPVQ